MPQREIAYDHRALHQLITIGGGEMRHLDARMAVLEWALWLNAEDFPVIDGFRTIRVTRLPGHDKEPTLRVFFDVENGAVTILWIDTV